MNFLFHSSRTWNSIVDSGQENIGWVCCPDVRARITKIQEDTHVLMGTNKRNQERTSYIKKCASTKYFKRKQLSLFFLSYRHHPVAFITCDTYTHTHTHNKKKLGVLCTQIMIDKLFFKFPLKCPRNAENKNWSFNLHLPRAYERGTGTLIEYRVIWIDGY